MAAVATPDRPVENVQSKVKFRFTETQIIKHGDPELLKRLDTSKTEPDIILKQYNIVRGEGWPSEPLRPSHDQTEADGTYADQSNADQDVGNQTVAHFADSNSADETVDNALTIVPQEIQNASFCCRHMGIVKAASKALRKNHGGKLLKLKKQMAKLEKSMVSANCPQLMGTFASMSETNRKCIYNYIIIAIHLVDAVNRCMYFEKSKSIPVFIEGCITLLRDIATRSAEIQSAVSKINKIFGFKGWDNQNAESIVSAFKIRVFDADYSLPAGANMEQTWDDMIFIQHYEPTSETNDLELSTDDLSKVESYTELNETEEDVIDEVTVSHAGPHVGLSLDRVPVDVNEIKGYGGSKDIREAYGFKHIDLDAAGIGEVATFLPANLVSAIHEGMYDSIDPIVFVMQGVLLAHELDLRLFLYMNRPDATELKSDFKVPSAIQARRFMDQNLVIPTHYLNKQNVTEVYTAGNITPVAPVVYGPLTEEEIQNAPTTGLPFIGVRLDKTDANITNINGFGGSKDIRDEYGYTKIEIPVKNRGKIVTYLSPEMAAAVNRGDHRRVNPNTFLMWGVLLAEQLDLRLHDYLRNPTAAHLEGAITLPTLARAESARRLMNVIPTHYLNNRPIEQVYIAGKISPGEAQGPDHGNDNQVDYLTFIQTAPDLAVPAPRTESRENAIKSVEVDLLTKLKSMIDSSIANQLGTLDVSAIEASPDEMAMMEELLTDILFDIANRTSPVYLTLQQSPDEVEEELTDLLDESWMPIQPGNRTLEVPASAKAKPGKRTPGRPSIGILRRQSVATKPGTPSSVKASTKDRAEAAAARRQSAIDKAEADRVKKLAARSKK